MCHKENEKRKSRKIIVFSLLGASAIVLGGLESILVSFWLKKPNEINYETKTFKYVLPKTNATAM